MDRSAARLQFGQVTLIPHERVLLRDGQRVSLTPKAFELLAFLAANPGRLLTKDELLQAVWPDSVVEESNLAYTVFAIRKALGESAESARYIETVPKRGYRFVAPVVQDEPDTDRVRLTEPAVSLLRFQERWWGRPSEPPSFSISPDGRHLVLGAEGPDGVPRLWVRTLSEASPRAVPGTESSNVVPPFWSPDSSFLAWASGGPLKKISLSGGTPQTICDITPNCVGGSWNRDDIILLGNPNGGVIRCLASGGGATFATRTAEPGDAAKLADGLGSYLDYAYYSASEKLLAYRGPDPPSQLTWFDREGRPVAPVGGPEAVAGLAVSPDGSFALVARHVPHNVVAQDLWLFDLRRDTNPRRVTFAPTLASFPVWVTSERFIFRLGGGPDGSVYEQTIGGQRRLLFSRNGEFPMPTSATAGGRAVVFTTVADPAMGADIWIWTDKAAPLITREGDQSQAQLSPDGRWLAYVSNETGRNEVFVASFRFDESTGNASVGDSMPVSNGGGFAPRWRGDGKELLYLKIDGSVMAIEADAARTFSSGPARRLFTAPDVLPDWGVAHDGSRLLFSVPTAPPPPLNILYDWQAGLPN